MGALGMFRHAETIRQNIVARRTEADRDVPSRPESIRPDILPELRC